MYMHRISAFHSIHINRSLQSYRVVGIVRVKVYLVIRFMTYCYEIT